MQLHFSLNMPNTWINFISIGLCIILFSSCDNEVKKIQQKSVFEFEKIDYKEDSLVLYQEMNRQVKYQVDTTRGIDYYNARIIEDTIVIDLIYGFMEGNHLTIKVHPDSTNILMSSFGCTSISIYDFTTLSCNLQLDTSFLTRDSIVGNIEFKAIESIKERLKYNEELFPDNYDPLKISLNGMFKLKIDPTQARKEYDRWLMISKEKYSRSLLDVKTNGDRALFATNLNLESIPNEILQLDSIKSLDLSHNDLAEYDFSKLDKMERLEWINLSTNGLTSFPKGITELKHLKKLILSHNRIENIPVQELLRSNIEYINLIGNELPDTTLNKLKSKMEVKN